MDNQEVWVIGEYDSQEPKNITLELLSEGEKLARRFKTQLCVCLMGPGLEKFIPTLSQYGAEKVYLVEQEMLSEYDLEAYTMVLYQLITKYNPSILLLGATPLGSELAPRISARLRLPCIAEAKKISGSKRNFR